MQIRKEYPRPQLRRDNWVSLNGQWQFEFDDTNEGIAKNYYNDSVSFSKKINVPFSYQFKESGIGDTSIHEIVWYKRKLTLTKEQLAMRTLLCFNGCDYIADVWVNGIHVITHEGAYTAFKCDITHAVRENNEIAVRCFDPLDPTIPRGKQSWTNEKFGCWYIPNSGIWQSVWVEFFGEDCLDDYSLITNIDNCSIYGELRTLRGKADTARLTVCFKDRQIKTQTVSLSGKHNFYSVALCEQDFVDDCMFWSPEKPNLMYLDIELLCNGEAADVTHTRFGMRKISIDEYGNWCLNNQPLYQRLILDQGFWVESGITPPSVDAIKKDIELSVKMGFNGARKHQKIEDPYFYYYAEEMGFLVWCEMPSAYNFNACEQQRLMSQWQEIVKTARNFTSVICYVPLNESWGVRKILTNPAQQDFARSLYYATKALDDSRIVSTNDGWENLDATDIISVHDYAFSGDGFETKYALENLESVYPQHRKLLAEGVEYAGQPVLMTEYGGIAMQSEMDEAGENWGYNDCAKTKAEFYARYENLLNGIADCKFQGFCYTQLTDVQQEVNGLLDANHNPKFDVEKICKLTKIKQ